MDDVNCVLSEVGYEDDPNHQQQNAEEEETHYSQGPSTSSYQPPPPPRPLQEESYYRPMTSEEMSAAFVTLKKWPPQFVSQFPDKEKLEGCNFKVAFPTNNPRFIVVSCLLIISQML